ncbi:nicotinate-nucleotide--dimethylbenzimidazole phosphoribosyltransferase [Tianweitania sp. BSSL-BM11]|uniref:Nicotinate-nucleotide--dimethylbenzimidazole phosphoribosyltransferase n=1 Tax=Tianweitania aestuarii TaxID=2814886 RepID=A0ABS5RU92_9HYPH|nr:nicotinate-nucleotide--dimethylbenzimidazole phosphoribosyltransferase [Tianweitania aestuarii]MBS9720581.1 nicotinate-nucleotide--dimethylbenzimidazole phosphoribosyltransferase [Tianweitania aestuarii]
MTRFTSIDQLRSACRDLPKANDTSADQARDRQGILTKPPGSLGRLEDLAVWLAGWQGREKPKLDRVEVFVFAGSHGVTNRGVSAFPAEVTAQMVANFEHGGAAINQLARQVGANLTVIPLHIDQPTVDFTIAPAMDEDAFLQAVSTGYEAIKDRPDLVVLGEMGIGNTTVAAALCCALLGGEGADWVGRGTGVDDEGLSRKASAVDDAKTCHGEALGDPIEALRRVGGRELAAMFGAILAARHAQVSVLLDGFVSTAAALPLAKLDAHGLDHTWSAHVSAEAGHRRLLEALHLTPLLDLNMRLGEASGACLAVNILRGAIACHNGMATFAEAGVSDG